MNAAVTFPRTPTGAATTSVLQTPPPSAGSLLSPISVSSSVRSLTSSAPLQQQSRSADLGYRPDLLRSTAPRTHSVFDDEGNVVASTTTPSTPRRSANSLPRPHSAAVSSNTATLVTAALDPWDERALRRVREGTAGPDTIAAIERRVRGQTALMTAEREKV